MSSAKNSDLRNPGIKNQPCMDHNDSDDSHKAYPSGY